MAEHTTGDRELDWSIGRELERKDALIADLLAGLEAIESLTSEEIKARFGAHPSKSEEEVAGKSAIYHLLVLPRNIARSTIAKAEGRDG